MEALKASIAMEDVICKLLATIPRPDMLLPSGNQAYTQASILNWISNLAKTEAK